MPEYGFPLTRIFPCQENMTAWEVSKYGVFSGPHFPAFGLNNERYEVSLHIQSVLCGKIRTRKNSVGSKKTLILAYFMQWMSSGKSPLNTLFFYNLFVFLTQLLPMLAEIVKDVKYGLILTILGWYLDFSITASVLLITQ